MKVFLFFLEKALPVRFDKQTYKGNSIFYLMHVMFQICSALLSFIFIYLISTTTGNIANQFIQKRTEIISCSHGDIFDLKRQPHIQYCHLIWF